MKAAPINDLNCTATKKVREVQLLGNSEQLGAADADDDGLARGLEVDLLLLLQDQGESCQKSRKKSCDEMELYDTYAEKQHACRGVTRDE